MNRKGIILAGGTGSRLLPFTKTVNKQLLPIYDKPMIYYPIATLMLAGIREILIITTPKDKSLFEELLGDGNSWGISLEYFVQDKPNGLAEVFKLAHKFINESPSALILGDNLFHGDNLIKNLNKANLNSGASIFAYPVVNPSDYGVVELSKDKAILSIEEKPLKPKSRYAITGLYFYDNSVIEKVHLIKPSNRGELEITDLNKIYLDQGELNVELFSRGMAWLDTGSCDSMHDASSFIRTLEHRQGLKVGCPEEIAWRNKWITNKELEKLAKSLIKSNYGEYLINLIQSSE